MKKIRMVDFKGDEWILSGINYGESVTTLHLLNTRSQLLRTIFRYNCCACYFVYSEGKVQRIKIRSLFPNWDSYNIPI